ncbi:MAG: mechanosensitive ion channel [Actinobacteria bacterium]|nr:mechanosensitive ion channel [Actinomycetota bacterium]
MNVMTANLLLDSLRDLWDGFVSRLPSIVTGLLVILVFYILARVVRYLTEKSLKKVKASEHAALITARLVFIGVMVVGVMVSLGVMGINAGALVASLGLVSVGIGFALKDVIENFIAGMILIFQRPFVVGDVVCFGDVEGRVEDVRVRDTVIRMYDGRQVFVPNAKIFSNSVINNDFNRSRRLEFEVSVAYAEDASAAMVVARDALAGIADIMVEPPPLVVAEELGESSVVLKVYFWIDPTKANFLEVKSAAVAAVKQELQKADIEIPFPVLTLRKDTHQ